MSPSVGSSNATFALFTSNNPDGTLSPEPPTTIQKYLNSCKSFYSCIHCRAHLANHDDLISRTFHGRHGRAHLFDKVINIVCGQPVQRHMITGFHLVSDIHCGRCETTLGWKYQKAYADSQKYKEGKFVIELIHVIRENRHLELDESDIFFGQDNSSYKRSRETNHNNFSDKGSNCDSPSRSTSSSTRLSYQEALANLDKRFDEDLLFTYYEDWCASRSSYPVNLSWNHFNRRRRSLYLDSKPYDWKHSDNSELHFQGSQSVDVNDQRKTIRKVEASLYSSDESPSPCSSSRGTRGDSYNLSEQDHLNKNNGNTGLLEIPSAHNYHDLEGHDMQFPVELELDSTNHDRTEESTPMSLKYNLSDAQSTSDHNSQRVSCLNEPSSMTLSQDTDDITVDGQNHESDSMSSDDEEFYDCYLSHDTK